MTTPSESVTRLLLQWRQGDRGAQERLMALVYDGLRRRAAHTLQPTALVHDGAPP